MAAAVRVTGSPPLALAGSGHFGRRVVDMLDELYLASLRVPADNLGDAFASDAAAVVLALSWPSPETCRRADELAYATGKPWLPVIAEHPVLRAGPLIVPPRAPCFACFQARRWQHDSERRTTAALLAAAERGTAERGTVAGPGGYLPHHARLASAAAATLLDGNLAGQVIAYDVLDGSIGRNPVIACDDCEREHGSADPDRQTELARVAAMASAIRDRSRPKVTA
jgi:bacteriocin biosynthesis cyclodehydratase domain-containing protein